MIVVIADIHIQPGRKEDFLTEFNGIVADVRAENGCIEYGPTVDAETDIEAQERHDDCVTIVEKWESVEALKTHLVAPHMQAYRERVTEIVASVKLRILQPV